MPIKVKRRYLALQIESTEKFSLKDFIDAVWSSILKLYGEYGASQTGLTLIDYNDDKKLAIIRVSHTTLRMVRASLSAVTRIANNPASIQILTVSGTLKALRKRLKLGLDAVVSQNSLSQAEACQKTCGSKADLKGA